MSETKKPTILQRRDALKKLSAVAKAMVKNNQADSVNDALCIIYQQQGHEEIHSYKKWWELGYFVKRGESALLLWGQPKKGHKQEQTTGSQEDEYKFFPLAFVFSQQQVEKRT